MTPALRPAWRCATCRVEVRTADDVPELARYCTPCARRRIVELSGALDARSLAEAGLKDWAEMLPRENVEDMVDPKHWCPVRWDGERFHCVSTDPEHRCVGQARERGEDVP